MAEEKPPTIADFTAAVKGAFKEALTEYESEAAEREAKKATEEKKDDNGGSASGDSNRSGGFADFFFGLGRPT